MADISKMIIDETEYEIKDAVARKATETLNTKIDQQLNGLAFSVDENGLLNVTYNDGTPEE